MIVITCIATPKEGMAQEARAAARKMNEGAKKFGMIAYFWASNETDDCLRLYEVHENPDSVVNYISGVDVSELAAAVTFSDIQVSGDSTSPAMESALGAFGDVKFWTQV
jgi:hypothetical protein